MAPQVAEQATVPADKTVSPPSAENAHQPVASPREQTFFEWLTVERLLYGVALLLGAGLRLVDLAAQPLQTMEAVGAWTAWLAVSGIGGATGVAAEMGAMSPPTSPLLYSLQSLLFWTLGSGDVVARSVSAVVGIAMIGLTWWLRPFLGRGVALFLAFLMAIDPWLVAYSRLADGAILSAALGLLTLIGLMHLRGETLPTASAPRTWLWITAIAGGLLLVSGMHAWNFVPVFLLYLALFGWQYPLDVDEAAEASPPEASTVINTDGHAARDGEESNELEDAVLSADGLAADGLADETVNSVPAPEPNDRNSLGVALALFVGAALLGATGWLARPEGIGYISTSMTAWVAQFVSGEGIAYPWSWGLLRLMVDQPLLAIFGPVGLVYLWWKRPEPATRHLPQWPLFLTLWTAWGVLLLASPGRNPLGLLMLGLPLLFATAHAADGIVRNMAWRSHGREILSLYAALIVLWTSGLFWIVALISRNQFDGALARVSLVVVGLGAVMIVFFALWVNARQALLATAFFVGCVFFCAALSSSWQLNIAFDPARPDGFFAETTDPDVRRLAENVQTLSAQRAGDPGEIPVLVEMRGLPDPLLGWYLRDMRRLTWTPALGLDANVPPDALLISQEDALRATQLGAGYLGDDYGIRLRWLPTPWFVGAPAASEQPGATWSTRWQPLLRWMVYRAVGQLPPSERVVLWAPPS